MYGKSFSLVGVDPLEGDNGRRVARKTQWLLTAPSPPSSPLSTTQGRNPFFFSPRWRGRSCVELKTLPDTEHPTRAGKC